MIVAITVFVVLATFHFVYEAIVAPSLRTFLRHDVYALRDRLRGLKAQPESGLQDQHYYYLQDSLNIQIRFLHCFDLWLLHRMQVLEKKDGILAKRVATRVRVLDDCAHPEAHEIRAQSIRIALKALTINTFGWSIYLIPVFFAIGCYQSVRDLIKALISMPEPDIDRMKIGATPSSHLLTQ